MAKKIRAPKSPTPGPRPAATGFDSGTGHVKAPKTAGITPARVKKGGKGRGR